MRLHSGETRCDKGSEDLEALRPLQKQMYLIELYAGERPGDELPTRGKLTRPRSKYQRKSRYERDDHTYGSKWPIVLYNDAEIQPCSIQSKANRRDARNEEII